MIYAAVDPIYVFLSWFFRLVPIIFLLIILINLFKLIKDKKKQKLPLILNTTALLITFVVGELFGFYQTNYFGNVGGYLTSLRRSVTPEVPPNVKFEVDSYLTGKIGSKEDFNKYFKYIPGKSYKNSSDRDEYLLMYEFTPYKAYGVSELQILVVNGHIREVSDRIQLPNCEYDPTLCDFSLTEKEFKNIVSENNIDDYIYTRPPYIFGAICPSGKFLRINYTTKLVDDSPVGLERRSMFNACLELQS